MKNWLLTVFSLFVFVSVSYAQYFGRNKPRYEKFDFKVVETPHFRIHHYLKNPELVERLSKTSEQWYHYHKNIFGKDINFKNPIIFYSSHADFQQTNTISGEIGIGTGGVTEALKNRVVLPIAFSNQSTHHVLAHELVHAFQFNNILTNDSTSLRSLANLPLWMIEGMAEYFSLGKVDPFTAMWMRDAIINKNLPELHKMNDPRYFPYRFGHSALSFLGGTFGDDQLNPLFMSTAKYGLELGFLEIFGQDIKAVSSQWHDALKNQYAPYMRDMKESPSGKKLIHDKNSGRINISPSLSPNGRYMIFLSEKDLFSTDLYLADVQKGTIVSKVTSYEQSGDLDYINVMESAGAWAPNGKDFAFIGVKKGRNVLVIKDAESAKTLETIEVSNVQAFSNPTYHPNGKEILVTGLVEGQTDLYLVNLRTKKARQLTNDVYTEAMADFAPDGKSVIFSYDKRSFTEGRQNGRYSFDIAEMDIETGEIKTYDFFYSADNLNPVHDHEGNFYFVSDRDGFRNLYKYNKTTGQVFQMTDLLTGISGISGSSPMISASIKRDRMVYTHYFNSQYVIYEASSDKLLNKLIEDVQTVNLTAGTLPATGIGRKNIVANHFASIDKFSPITGEDMKKAKYRPNFKLDYIGGGAAVGVGVNNNSFRNATGMQGGIDMLFGDLLGNHQIYSQVALSGEILDFGGMATYINRQNRLAWGVGFSHIPLRTGFQSFGQNFLEDQNGNVIPVLQASTNLIRIFDQSINVFAHYPFSKTLRLEMGVAGTNRSFRWDEYNDYYIGNQFTGYRLVAQDRMKIPTGESIRLDNFYTVIKGTGANANLALVGDNSFFGLTAPLAGHRYRIGLEHYVGNDKYSAFLMDGRKYFRVKPFTLAFRGTSYLRFEKEVNSVYPLFIGNMGFVRGLGSIVSDHVTELGLTYGQLLGSKMLLGSFEVRLPFTGPKQLALIPFSGFFSDLNLFVDAGVAFDEFRQFSEGKDIYAVVKDESGRIVLDPSGVPVYAFQNLKPTIVPAVGLSVRINLFGAMIIEPYWSKVLLNGSRVNFGLNLIPGW
ncbi:MAG: PD40 domain-containing protein [Saprospiraceae bacterium]|nr:PD40 domain-containing protein [Saprospiraceae bacterium]